MYGARTCKQPDGEAETDTGGLRPEIRANLQSVIDMTPLRRIGTPQDVAEVVGFLASDHARWITGQAIGASGGLA